ncbi:MAG TPA: GAF domain-containing protein [Solirubrobacteraceae bacterium]|nr:GAF domain-containing protein [Solirubrobacteraceae bacterium]
MSPETSTPGTTVDSDQAPAVRIDALERIVDLLARVEEDGSSDAFYGRLCEATCALTSMERAIIFRYDEAHRRVRAVGTHNISLDAFAGVHITVEDAAIARQALMEDRVIDVPESAEIDVPESFRDILRDGLLVCTPIAASGRWTGVILSDRKGRDPLPDSERYLLWTIGKTVALATHARVATTQQERARQLQERIDLARDIHEGVIQRLFGITMAFSSENELSREARDRIADELHGALLDLRRALQRPLGRMSRPTQTTLLAEVERLQREHPDLGLRLKSDPERLDVPSHLEALAQSVLIEAVRNAHKHAEPTEVEVALEHIDGAWVMEVCNDGLLGDTRPESGMGLRLAALEALQAGGIVEFGKRDSETWRVRLAVPLERA